MATVGNEQPVPAFFCSCSYSCMGCGRTIAAEFLGIKKDYSPCRFADGLFCRRCIHLQAMKLIIGVAVGLICCETQTQTTAVVLKFCQYVLVNVLVQQEGGLQRE